MYSVSDLIFVQIKKNFSSLRRALEIYCDEQMILWLKTFNILESRVLSLIKANNNIYMQIRRAALFKFRIAETLYTKILIFFSRAEKEQKHIKTMGHFSVNRTLKDKF